MTPKKTNDMDTATNNQHTALTDALLDSLKRHINPEKADVYPRFFKTGKGEYGEGDVFLGVSVPDTRLVSKQYRDAPFAVLETMLAHPIHEVRLCALMILRHRFERAKQEEERRLVCDFYLAHTAGINNWDLVDLSAYNILGAYLRDKTDRSVLYRLAASPNMWEQRIAIVSTMAFVRADDLTDCLRLAELFLTHTHDLMHKACGWLLREAGKRAQDVLSDFLIKHKHHMPRTMLRYAIEKYSPEERAAWLKRD